MEKNAPILSLPHRYGKYELVARLGSGGMAEIYLARQAGIAGFEKPTVIKRILPRLALDARMEEAFIAEARLMAEIRHPNVVHVYELDRLESGEFFMAMEYVEGTDLRALLKSATRSGLRLPPWLSVKITCDILDALRVVHDLEDDQGRSRNVVHRDITPSNIFISARGEVKLGDFGVAKDDRRRALTRRGEVKGKVAYMAPEQLERGMVDRRTDLFAMGVVLWESLAQRRLFGGSEKPDMVVMNMICSGPRIAPSRVRRDVHAGLDACVLRAISADADARHQSAEGFQTELLEVLDAIHGPVHTKEICEITDVLLGKKPPPERLALASVTPEGSTSGRWDGSWDQAPTELSADEMEKPPAAPPIETSYRGPFPFWIKIAETKCGSTNYFEAMKLLASAPEARISADSSTWLDPNEFADLTGQEAVRPPEEERTAVFHGALDQSSLIAVLASLGLSRATGVLRISVDGRDRTLVHVREGNVTSVSTDAPSLQAAEILVRDGTIQPYDVPALVHQIALERVPLEELAVRLGWSSSARAFHRELIKRRLLAILESQTDYDFYTLEPRGKRELETDLLPLLPELIREGMSAHGLKLHLDDALAKPMVPASSFAPEKLGGDEVDQEIVQYLLDSDSIAAAIRAHPEDEILLLSWSYLLLEAKMLLLEDAEARR